MAKHYLLPCICGQKIAVEVSKAGGTAVCACGKDVPIPSMLHLKKLPSADTGSSETSVSTARASSDRLPREPHSVFGWRVAVFFGVTFLLIAAVVAIWAGKSRPKPIDVILRQQTTYTFAGQVTNKGSKLASTDFLFFFYHPRPDSYYLDTSETYMLTEEVIDHMTPMDTFVYWQALKDGPKLSSEYDNAFQHLKNLFAAKLIVAGILAVSGTVLLLVSLVMPKHQRTIADRKGTTW